MIVSSPHVVLWSITPALPFWTAGNIGLVGVVVFAATVDERCANRVAGRHGAPPPPSKALDSVMKLLFHTET